MNNEIKEILKDDDELLVNYKDGSFESFDTLPKNVLDYITNLQEENILLKEDKKDLREGWQQEIYDKDEILHNWYVAQGKIEKAIEYIKENKEHRKGLSVEEYHNKWCKMIDYYESLEIMNDLLNILEGDDKE